LVVVVDSITLEDTGDKTHLCCQGLSSHLGGGGGGGEGRRRGGRRRGREKKEEAEGGGKGGGGGVEGLYG